MTAQTATDGRRARGDRTRKAIARRAVDLASLDGLDGLSIGQLADDLGLSKSGVATLFGSKEQLQLAATVAAGQAFHESVVEPASRRRQGLRRLRSLTKQWLEYALEPLFPGGCFWSANLAEFDSHPGPVRDALIAQHVAWLELLSGELRRAVDAGEIAPLDPDLTAFQLDAVLSATNIALRLERPGAATMARRLIDGMLRPPDGAA